ncbi:uncharacterized protein DS421_12g366470 [Arachis hypogaea]|nr:uncharacterized protein DS421_12g366470 [Arachis hypogaea]
MGATPRAMFGCHQEHSIPLPWSLEIFHVPSLGQHQGSAWLVPRAQLPCFVSGASVFVFETCWEHFGQFWLIFLARSTHSFPWVMGSIIVECILANFGLFFFVSSASPHALGHGFEFL